MIRTYLLLAMLFVSGMCSFHAKAQEVAVTLTTDEGYANRSIIEKMQYNLSQVLSEINRAQKENRPLNIVGLPLQEDAVKALTMLWANIHFYCDDTEIVERCWEFDGGKEYMVSHIPLIIDVQGEDFGNGTYQEAVVDFDQTGAIKDFRFTLDAQLAESFENCGNSGSVIETERKMKILAYCERFRTAYNQKDINFLRTIFSDDALIITGNVVRTKPGENKFSDNFKVTYKKQTKQQYLANLQRAFLRNKWIDVKFENIGEVIVKDGQKSCPGLSQSKVNPNMYGVRLVQKWQSSTYSDEGFLFLLWDFTNEDEPMIHVRTWQPTFVGKERLPEEEIFTLDDFGL